MLPTTFWRPLLWWVGCGGLAECLPDALHGHAITQFCPDLQCQLRMLSCAQPCQSSCPHLTLYTTHTAGRRCHGHQAAHLHLPPALRLRGTRGGQLHLRCDGPSGNREGGWGRAARV